MNVAC